MITLTDLERFFIKNKDWIDQKILKVASYSNYPVIYCNTEDCLDIISELWIILSKEKNLNSMRNDSDIKGKINNICYLLLTKSGSTYIRRKNFKNENGCGYINEYMLDNLQEEEEEVIDDKLQLILDNVDIFMQEADIFDRNLYNIYYVREINTVRSLANHLKISERASYQLILKLNYILERMIKYGDKYNDIKKELNRIDIINKDNLNMD